MEALQKLLGKHRQSLSRYMFSILGTFL